MPCLFATEVALRPPSLLFLAALLGVLVPVLLAALLALLLLLAGDAGSVRVGGSAGDRIGLELVRVVGLLAADLDLAVLVEANVRGAELGSGGLVVRGLVLGPAEGLVLGAA